MDVDALIEQLERLMAEARPVPLSSSVMVNRQDVDELLTELRSRLPEEMRQSRWILKERDELLAQAARESEQLLADTREERDRILAESELVRAAERESERILSDAREQARVLRLEAEDYVDGKLANFEIALQRTMKQVEKGRERLRGRLASDELAEAEEGDAREEPSSQFYDYEQPDEHSP